MQSVLDPELALDDALGWHHAGEWAKAEAGYRQVLQASPDHLDALNFLGALLQDCGRDSESLAMLERAVTLEPDFAEALSNLARLQQKLGHTEAVDTARRAIAADPELPQAHLLLGRALLDRAQFTEAEPPLRRALQLDPELLDARLHLGSALRGQGQLQDARDVFAAVQITTPAPVDTLLKIAGAWLGAGFHEEAIGFYQQAIGTDPRSTYAHAGLAFARYRLQQPNEALAACRTALSLSPDNTEARLLLGQILIQLGQFDAAAAEMRQVLVRDPTSIGARHELAAIRQLHPGDSDAAQFRSALHDPERSMHDRITAAFSLGALLDTAGEYDGAFEAYRQANALVHDNRQKLGRGFNPTTVRGLVDWLVTNFPAALFNEPERLGQAGEDLVFVVGMPRSGTSLVEQIAASHSQVFGAGERNLIDDAVRRLNDGPDQKPPSGWNAATVARQAAETSQAYRDIAGSARLIIDKLPDNIWLLGHIAVLFPRARIVFCKRDARDTCLSAFFQHFGSEMVWCYDLLDCAEQAQQVARLTGHWRSVLKLHMLEVEYEALVGDLEGQSRRLIAFLGLDWEPACLLFHETNRPVTTASVWQVRQPLYATSIARWRNYRKHLSPLIFSLLGLVPPPEAEDWSRLLEDIATASAAGLAHHRAGRLSAARQIYDAILAHDPENAAVQHFLGVWFLNHQRPDDALPCLVRAAEDLGNDAKLQADLACAYLATGHVEASVRAARAAVALDPEWADGWCQLGNALGALGDVHGAQDALQQAVALGPEDRGSLIGIARLMLAQRQPEAAEPLLRRADRLYPGDEDILFSLSMALADMGQVAEGIEAGRQALQLHPQSRRLVRQVAGLMIRNRVLQPAIELLQGLVRHDDGAIEAWVLLAFGHALAGAHAEAEACYRKALSLDPDHPEALAGLLGITHAEVSDDLLAAAARVPARTSAAASDRAGVAFALAHRADRQGRYDAAFALFSQANGIVRGSRDPGLAERLKAEEAQLTELLMARFSRAAMPPPETFGTLSDTPVFVVGLPRSGTSLVEQILASHPGVCGLGEQGEFPELLAGASLPALLRPWQSWDADEMQAAARQFLATMKDTGNRADRVVNKAPGNLRWIGHIAALLPRARVIVCRRDLRDVLWSCYTQHFFDPGLAWTDTLADCADHARQAERLMDHWRMLLPGRFLEVFYEDVVQDLEHEARRMIDYLDLPWDAACLDFHRTQRNVLTASHWQVRQPLYATSVGRWRPYRRHLGPLLAGLRGLIPEMSDYD